MKYVPVQVDKISYHPPSHSYAIILRDFNGKKSLPVVVGAFEAQSIALAMENVQTPRPMTHDLLVNMLNEVDIVLSRVAVTELNDGVYYARLELESSHFGKRSIDARPSDAIAIALRTKSPILVADDILEDESLDINTDVPPAAGKAENLTKAELEVKLDLAIKSEEYETAAMLRDQLKEFDS